MVLTNEALQARLAALKAKSEKVRGEDPEAFEREVADFEAVRKSGEAADRATRLERSGVDAELPDATRVAVLGGKLTEFEPLKVTRKWLASKTRPACLILAGSTGTGKTVAAADAIAQLGGLFVSARECEAAFASMFGAEAEYQKKLLTACLLVVDDLGTERDKDRMSDALTLILSRRASASRHPTILTANMSTAAFRARYNNERLMSRFAQSGQWVAIGSEQDLRQLKKRGR